MVNYNCFLANNNVEIYLLIFIIEITTGNLLWHSGSALPAMQPMANQSTYYTPGPPSMQQTGYYPTQLGSSSLQVF